MFLVTFYQRPKVLPSTTPEPLLTRLGAHSKWTWCNLSIKSIMISSLSFLLSLTDFLLFSMNKASNQFRNLDQAEIGFYEGFNFNFKFNQNQDSQKCETRFLKPISASKMPFFRGLKGVPFKTWFSANNLLQLPFFQNLGWSHYPLTRFSGDNLQGISAPTFSLKSLFTIIYFINSRNLKTLEKLEQESLEGPF